MMRWVVFDNDFLGSFPKEAPQHDTLPCSRYLVHGFQPASRGPSGGGLVAKRSPAVELSAVDVPSLVVFNCADALFIGRSINEPLRSPSFCAAMVRLNVPSSVFWLPSCRSIALISVLNVFVILFAGGVSGGIDQNKKQKTPVSVSPQPAASRGGVVGTVYWYLLNRCEHTQNSPTPPHRCERTEERKT